MSPFIFLVFGTGAFFGYIAYWVDETISEKRQERRRRSKESSSYVDLLEEQSQPYDIEVVAGCPLERGARIQGPTEGGFGKWEGNVKHVGPRYAIVVVWKSDAWCSQSAIRRGTRIKFVW